MKEEKRMVLEMLNNGDINVDEAERLLNAIPTEKENSDLAHRPNSIDDEPRKLIVVVTNNNTGKRKVNLRVPISLIKAALKIGKASIALGANFTSDMETKQILELIKEIDIDEILESVNDGEITLPYTMIDIDSTEDGENDHIEIILE